MPKRIHVEEKTLYPKMLMVFSVVQLVGFLGLYVMKILRPLVWVSSIVWTLVGCLLVHYLWERRKAARIVVRIVCLLVLGATTAGQIVFLVFWGLEQIGPEDVGMFALALEQWACLILLPIFAMAANRGFTFDLVVLRVTALLEVALAGLTCYDAWAGSPFLLGSRGLYVVICFLLCTMATAALSFIIYPISCPRLLRRNRKAGLSVAEEDSAEA